MSERILHPGKYISILQGEYDKGGHLRMGTYTHTHAHTYTQKQMQKKETKNKLRDQLNVYEEFSIIAEAALSNPTWK